MRVDLLFVVPLLAITLSGGSCRSLNGESDDAPQRQQSRCQERAAEAQEDVESVRLANRECSTHSDCTLFDPSTLCRGECPNAVAVARLQAVEGAIDRVNESICRGYVADGCPVATPGCVAATAKCEAGACVSGSAN